MTTLAASEAQKVQRIESARMLLSRSWSLVTWYSLKRCPTAADTAKCTKVISASVLAAA